jgi:hypothetical protein
LSPETGRAGLTANETSPVFSLSPESFPTTTHNPIDLQARKLQRLCSFVHATARNLAEIAWGVR